MVLTLSTNLKEIKVTEAWFLKLKEYDSLLKMRNSHLQRILEQEERMTKLKGQQEEAYLRREKLRQEERELQQKLFELEQKLKTTQEQCQRLRDLGGDENKISSYQQQAEALESEGMTLLETIDQSETEISEAQQFLDGIEKTIEEIAQEVNEVKERETKEIKNLELRLQLLEEELPADFRDRLHKTLSKKLALGPFTRVEAGSCYMCRYKISRIEESEIDMQKNLKVCASCGRIFLPYGA